MKRTIRSTIAVSFTIFAATGTVFAQGGFGGQRAVQETQVGPNTEYNVIDATNLFAVWPFNVVAFAVKSNGGNPSTVNPHWTAQEVDATSWAQPMGGNPANPSWFGYTGLSYTAAFPSDPAGVNGYVVDFGSGRGIAPGTSLDGFFFQGAPSSTDHFLLVNDHGPVIVQGQPITDSGTVEVVPEPGSLSLCLVAFATLLGGALVTRVNRKLVTGQSRRDTLKRGHRTGLLGVHALACPPTVTDALQLFCLWT